LPRPALASTLAFMRRRIPDWILQLTWFAAGLSATGAFWYFLAQHNRIATISAGLATGVFVVVAVILQIYNDSPHGESKPEINVPRPASPSDGIPSVETVGSPAAPRSGTSSSMLSKTVAAEEFSDPAETAITASDDTYSPMTMEEYFDEWFNKATTSLQRSELERRMMGRRIVWTGVVEEIKEDRSKISVRVSAPAPSYGTAFLSFDQSQREQLLQIHEKQRIRFTGVIHSFVASPFLQDCRIMRILSAAPT
jgi:hypothetical protein